MDYAKEQGGRPVLACPGDAHNPRARLCNQLITTGRAGLLTDGADVMRAVGVTGDVSHKPKPVKTGGVDVKTLSTAAQTAFTVIDRTGKCFDDLLAELPLRSGELVAAGFELTSNGLVVEHPGRRYEKV